MSLRLIIDDVQRAIEGGAPYAALCASVTLPELCGRCEQKDVYATKGTNSEKAIFNRFVNKYLADWPLGLTGDDLHNLRCGISHRGQTANRGGGLQYVFHPPHPNGHVVHNVRTYAEDGTVHRINVDLQTFCDDIAAAVCRWEKDNVGNEVVHRNLMDVLQVRDGTFGTAVKVAGLVYIG